MGGFDKAVQWDGDAVPRSTPPLRDDEAARARDRVRTRVTASAIVEAESASAVAVTSVASGMMFQRRISFRFASHEMGECGLPETKVRARSAPPQ